MSSQRFRCLLRGSFTLVSLIHTCRDHQGHAFSPGRSPPQLLTKAAPGGLEPPPTRRLRRTYLHLPYSLTLSRLLDTITLTSLVVGTITNSRASSLHGHYSASSLLQARPIPSRRPPISRCCRLYGFSAPSISRRDEEGFSSCSA